MHIRSQLRKVLSDLQSDDDDGRKRQAAESFCSLARSDQRHLIRKDALEFLCSVLRQPSTVDVGAAQEHIAGALVDLVAS